MTAYSSIYSLADSCIPQEVGVSEAGRFIDIGASAQGNHHVMILYRDAFFSRLNFAHKSPIRLGKCCVAYPMINQRDVPYGHLFCVDKSRTEVYQDRLIIRNHRLKGDFALFPFEEKSLYVYKDSAGNLLIKTVEAPSCRYLVLDE